MQYHGNNGLQIGSNNGNIYYSGGGGNKNGDDGAVVMFISISCLILGVYGLLHYRDVILAICLIQFMAMVGSALFVGFILYEEHDIAWQDTAVLLWNSASLFALIFLIDQVYQYCWANTPALREVHLYFSQTMDSNNPLLANKASNFLYNTVVYLFNANHQTVALAGIGWIGALGFSAGINAIFALSNLLRFIFPSFPAIGWFAVFRLNACLWIPISVIWSLV